MGVRRLFQSLVAFSFVGFFITSCSALSYWLLSGPADVDPNLALLAVFCVFTMVGHFLHGRFSFRDQTKGRLHGRTFRRYLLINVLGFAMNQLFVLAFVKLWHWPDWTPVVPFVVVTPVFIFVTSRYWAFRSTREIV